MNVLIQLNWNFHQRKRKKKKTQRQNTYLLSNKSRNFHQRTKIIECRRKASKKRKWMGSLSKLIENFCDGEGDRKWDGVWEEEREIDFEIVIEWWERDSFVFWLLIFFFLTPKFWMIDTMFFYCGNKNLKSCFAEILFY